MIFKQWREIADGKKPQTRRIAKGGEYAWTCGVTHKINPRLNLPYTAYSSIHAANDRPRFKRDHTYAVVPKRGGKTVQIDGKPLRIKITSLHREPLQEITEDEAKAEGVESVATYRELWDSINGKTKGARWQDNPYVWVITFELESR